MAYHCNDCTYKGKVSGQSGECPACGSFNISMRVGKTEHAAPTKTKKWRLVLVAALWGYLILHIAWKLLS